MLRYKRIPKEIYIVRNRIILQAAILDCSEAAVQSHPFSKLSPGNTDGKVILWSNYRLTVHSSNYILKWLRQERFLGNLPKAFGAPKCHRL